MSEEAIPKINTTTNKKDTELDRKIPLQTSWRASLPFIIGGALMILAAVVSAYLGFNLLTSYRTSLYNGRFVSPDYAGLYVGLLNLVAFGLDLFAALLLLLRKYVSLAEALVGIVLAGGLAASWIFTYYHSPFIYMYYGQFLLQGLFVVTLMTVFSIATLIIIRLNRKKLKQDTNTNTAMGIQAPKE